MTTGAPASPQLAEFQALPNRELGARYARGIERIERRLLELTDAQLDTFFAPEAGVGRWSCRVLLGHLVDADMSFIHRIRRAVAEDRPVFSVWDENAFIDSGLYGGPAGGKDKPVAAFVAVLHTLRRWHAEWMGTLTDAQWARAGLHPERGEQSVRVIMNYATWHLEHHAWFLSRKLERLLGPRPQEP